MKNQHFGGDSHQVSRRDLLSTAGAAVVGTVFGAGLLSQQVHAHAAAPSRRVLRLAHLTDVHVQPERGGEQGMIACLRHVQSLDDPPDLILTGGDSVMDAFDADANRTKVQADIWRRVLANECSLPVRSCIGNHDVWGWNRESSKTTGNEPLWGKSWGEDLLGLTNRYYRFDQAGWRFIVLDSTFPHENSYTAKLDDEQFDWLERELSATPAPMPVLILSHIPILSAAAFLDGKNEESGDWKVPGSWMHIDARRIKDLFLDHPNVKVCLSGHLHLVDQVQYNDVTYCCNGAVSGAWWKGKNQECDAGYGIVDLFADGSHSNQYLTFGWEPVEG